MNEKRDFRVTSSGFSAGWSGIVIVFGLLMLGVCLGIVIGKAFDSLKVGAIAVLLGLIAPFLLLLWPAKLRVGDDGLAYSWLWKRRFLARHDIVGATLIQRPISATRLVSGVAITLADGEVLEVLLESGGAPLATALAELISTVAGNGAIDDPRSNERRLLDRGGRSASDWFTHLRAVGAGADAEFRQAALSPERLAAMVEDQDMEPSLRAAASIALASDETTRATVRRIADATAHPELRVVLEAVADPDRPDAELATLLAGLAPLASNPQ